jgi:hypothetical protein
MRENGEVELDEEQHREVAKIRRELRERLMSERCEGVQEVLAALRLLAYGDDRGGGIADLRSEYERWRLRFELLALHRRN